MAMWRRRQPFPVGDEMLQRIRLFALLPVTERARLLPTARSVVYPRGEEIDADPDEQGLQLRAVVEGRLRISFRSASGDEMPVYTVDAGEVCALGKDGWAGADETVVTALCETLLCSMPLNACEAVIDSCPEARQALRTAERRVTQELGALASGLLHGPEDRIRHLIWQDTRWSPDGSVVYTHEVFAARACTTRSRTTTVFGELRRQGVIETDRKGHRIIVLDRERLR